MNKEECIQKKWVEAGFSWNQIKDIVDHEGGLMLDHPSLKTTIIGYKEAYAKGLLKGYDFNGSRLKVWNSLLDEINNNYGWTKINTRSDLPKTEGMYLFHTIHGRDVEQWHSEDVSIGGVTHWRPIINIPKPLY